jgi:hypothetical protein
MILVTVDTFVDLVTVVTVVFTDVGSGFGVVTDGELVVSAGASVAVAVSMYVGSSVG